MTDLILASGSQTRRKLLEAAGVGFRVVPADVDEDAIRASLADGQQGNSGISPIGMAERLASAKAEEVSRRFPHALVVGGDQILALGEEIFTKPADLAAAATALRRLAGRTHALHSAIALATGGATVWRHVDTARLTMRQLSEAAIDGYLRRAGEQVCASVGAYEIEGLGIQLFDAIDGDYFTILGLPLLPLLHELRRQAQPTT